MLRHEKIQKKISSNNWSNYYSKMVSGIFRFADDLQGLQDQAVTNQVVTVLIASYFAVFEQPLTVLIPATTSTAVDGGCMNIPALMINDALLSQQKRRSCSEERPPSPAQFSLVRLRRCSSSEDMMIAGNTSQVYNVYWFFILIIHIENNLVFDVLYRVGWYVCTLCMMYTMNCILVWMESVYPFLLLCKCDLNQFESTLIIFKEISPSSNLNIDILGINHSYSYSDE